MWLPCFFDDSVVTGEIPNSLRVIPDLTILTLLLQLFLEVVLTDQVIFLGRIQHARVLVFPRVITESSKNKIITGLGLRRGEMTMAS